MSALHLAAPALPLHTAGPYVAAAYIVFVLLILVYVAIMARRLLSTQRELAKLRADVERRARDEELLEGDGGRESDSGHERQAVL